MIYNPRTAPHFLFLPVMRTMAPKIGVALIEAPVADKAAIEDTLGKFAGNTGGGVIVMRDIFMTQHRDTVFALTNRHRIPTVSPLRAFAAAGSLVSYGSDFDDLFVRATTYVDRILRGEKAGYLPVQEPTKYELVVNLKTAKAIGIATSSGVACYRRRGDRVSFLPYYAGRLRIKNFCMPSSTSSRRWLKTVERSVTTPVVRPGTSSVTSSAG